MSELSLKTDGVEKITFSKQINEAASSVAEAWKNFQLLSIKEKGLFSPIINSDPRGYKNKISNPTSEEKKEIFDFTPSFGYNNFFNLHQNIGSEARHFIRELHELYSAAQPMLQDYWRRLQGSEHEPSFGDLDKAQRSARSVIIRCLYYPPGAEVGSIIGQPHVDISGGTTQFYETTPGCQFLPYTSHEWETVATHIGEGLQFGGMQAQLASDGEIKAKWHRVISNEITSEVGRSAIVGFIPLVDMPKYDNTKHGLVKAMKPGDNYGKRADNLYRYFST